MKDSLLIFARYFFMTLFFVFYAGAYWQVVPALWFAVLALFAWGLVPKTESDRLLEEAQQLLDGYNPDAVPAPQECENKRVMVIKWVLLFATLIGYVLHMSRKGRP